MKLMNHLQCLEWIDGATPAEITQTEAILNRVLCDEIVEGWLDRGLISGHYKITTVKNQGRPLYRYVWHVNDQGFLYVNGSLFVGQPGENDDWLWMIGAEAIARVNNCKGIRFESKRRGHLEQGLRAGFKATGVGMEKILEHVPS
jgi:hypothetical protein